MPAKDPGFDKLYAIIFSPTKGEIKMKGFIASVASALLLLSSTSFALTMQSLDKSQVNKLVKGKTIVTIPLITLDGSLVNNTFTGYFDTNGKYTGQMANKPDNGPINDTGTWKVKSNGTLCVTWDHWNSSKPICVSVYKVNNGLLFINEKNHKLETMVLDSNIKDGNQLS